ncbi:MAG: PEP-CTERM sorting domain-containing protein [Altererythrobacter sp.]|nr:PEP-CTERM sorting domain-containing protein [Altererythrobacter sp.]
MTKLSSFARATAVGAALVLSAGVANAAATLTFAGGTGGLTAGQTNYANFNTGPGGTFGSYVTSGTAGLYTGTTSIAAQPAFGDQGDQYFAVIGGGSATFSFGAAGASQFGFDLGSADDFNDLLITFVGGGTQLFSGAGLNPPGPASGNQNIAATNGRVTIFGNGQAIASAKFASRGNSFEFDNIGVTAVPEPATWAMLILGFGVMGGALRRKSRVAFGTRAALV